MDVKFQIKRIGLIFGVLGFWVIIITGMVWIYSLITGGLML